jgi:molybdate/tungstate transport system substrate-binding protein
MNISIDIRILSCIYRNAAILTPFPPPAPGGQLKGSRREGNAVNGSLLAAVILVSFIAACSGSNEKRRELIVFHAGSLSVPIKRVANAFEKEHPGVSVSLEAAGSRDSARKISDLGRACDVMASADYTVIDELLIPDHAEWNVKFAANEMAIVYQERSRLAGEIRSDNWPEILLSDRVVYGRSDPDSDPCGYRTVLTIELAERHYRIAGLGERLLEKDREYIRPKETDLLALLESNAIDYIFLYRSVAEQHGLKYILLPDEINLGSPAFADLYATVSVEVSGRDPGTHISKRGAPMIYGVTIPKNAPNPVLALEFVAFLLERDKGLKIMEEEGQPALIPSPTDTYDRIPGGLKRYALPGHAAANR